MGKKEFIILIEWCIHERIANHNKTKTEARPVESRTSTSLKESLSKNINCIFSMSCVYFMWYN